MHATTLASKLTMYDNSLDYLITFYDNLPYVRNWDYCNEHTLGLISGNVVKFFQYTLDDPIVVENHDDLTSVYLQKLQESTHSEVEAQPLEDASALLENASAAEEFPSHDEGRRMDDRNEDDSGIGDPHSLYIDVD